MRVSHGRDLVTFIEMSHIFGLISSFYVFYFFKNYFLQFLLAYFFYSSYFSLLVKFSLPPPVHLVPILW